MPPSSRPSSWTSSSAARDPASAATPTPAGTAIILFADIADSTALTERLGDAAFREKARALDDALRIAVRDNGGAVIDAKTLGDGILATFPAASQAIAAALRMRALRATRRACPCTSACTPAT